MKIVIDISPLTSGHYLQHRIRGTGFYLQHLKEALLQYYPKNDYFFREVEEPIPQDTDVLHIPYFEPFFLTLPGKQTKKTIVTVHDLTPMVFPDVFPSGLKGKIKWYLQKRSLRKADAIITDSESSRKDIVKYALYPNEKIYVVYLAAGKEFTLQNTKTDSQRIRKKYNLPDKFALYVGDVTWNKNLPRLIQAIMQTDIPLVLVGKTLLEKNYDKTNPWNHDLAETQSLTMNNKETVLLGFVSSEDLPFLYRIATVFVMPSLYEGFGLPVLEAMQSGCPVITTKKGSLNEVAGDAAEFVDPYDTNSIANGIKKVFYDINLQKELSRKGEEQAKKFSWKKTAEETMSVYKKVAGEKS